MAKLPYLASPGTLKNGLERIRSAATPDRVTQDFIGTKLQIKGGSGFALLPYLKKIGFVASDGSPTDLYKRFRNSATAGAAIADAIKIGYKDLLEANEYFYDLADKELGELIIQVTGFEAKSSAARQTLATLKQLKSFADFKAPKAAVEPEAPEGTTAIVTPIRSQFDGGPSRRIGMNLSYTINLNLPATSDQAVFNAIFRSLKEHLLADEE
jgi:Family of unknown function (DUF5343)